MLGRPARTPISNEGHPASVAETAARLARGCQGGGARCFASLVGERRPDGAQLTSRRWAPRVDRHSAVRAAARASVMRRWECSKLVGCTHPAFGAGSMISSASAEYLATSASTRQPTEQVESLDGCVERAGWEPRGPAVRFLRRQDVDALCAQLDRVGDRRVVDHAAVDQAGLTGRNRGGRSPGSTQTQRSPPPPARRRGAARVPRSGRTQADGVG